MNNSLPPSSNAAAPAVPIRLGHYELHDCIGRGGMGLVYRARDTRLEREVAIKCLRTELFEAHYVERFKREALLLAKLNHPNIVQIYDFIESPDQLALVMELVDGQNLQTYLREHIVSIAQRLQWLAQITEGLAIAHDAGIIHRDLKTENILINKRGQAKITDLGIAKSQDFNATLTDHVAGSYCSMSPEQAMGEAITFKSDLFSLGILAYQLLCGAHPFGDTSNKLQTMQRIIAHPPTAPQKHNPDLPAEFIDLLGQLLSKDPDKRPDNTHWVAAQFETLKTLHWQESTSTDDTQALVAPLPSTATRATRTQDHPTFDTRFVAMPITPKVSAWQKLKRYIAANKITLSSAAISILIVAGIVGWQLQPKPPKYVAVIPPTLTTEGMQESQQELVKGAVYDAIQQSVIQLDGYYLIPHTDISDAQGDNETVRRATAADELITTEIKCKVEACTITLSRLMPELEKTDSRLRVAKTKTIDVLTDDYLSVASTVQTSLNEILSQKTSNSLNNINKDDYASFLIVNHEYRTKGESVELLQKLDNLHDNTKKLAATETLYCDISLDLYHETKDTSFLDKAVDFIQQNNADITQLSHLLNLFKIEIAQNNTSEAQQLLESIKQLNNSDSAMNQLSAYLMMAKKDYDSAIKLYDKTLSVKATANTYYHNAIAHWYAGKSTTAKEQLKKSLELSPHFYNALSFLGTIYLLDGDLPSAIKTFAQIQSITPDDTFNLSNFGLALLFDHQYARALSMFDRAATIAPKNLAFKLNQADALGLLGEVKKSQSLYEHIANSESGDENSFLKEKAQAYAHLGQFSNALNALKELEKTDSQNIENMYVGALIHTLAQNKASAILYVDNALKNGMSSVWFNLPWFHSLCDDANFKGLMASHKSSLCAFNSPLTITGGG